METGFTFSSNCTGLPETIAREEIHNHFSWLTPGAMKNFDWRGEGPAGAFRIGKKIIYPTEELLAWLDSRMEKPAKKKKELSRQNQSVERFPKIPKSRRGRKTKEQEIRERRG